MQTKIREVKRKKSSLKANADAPNKVAMNNSNRCVKHKKKKGKGSYDRRKEKGCIGNRLW